MTNKKTFTVCGVLLLFLIAPMFLHSAPLTSVSYSETALDNGYWEYSFTLRNDSDPVADAGFDVYDFSLYFMDSSGMAPVFASLYDVKTPGGWDSMIFEGLPLDFAQWFSLIPGVPPYGTDIAPGEFLSGFGFTSDTQLFSIAYSAILENPYDPGNPFSYNGLASSDTPPIPEPGTLALLGGGLIALVFSARRFRK